MEKSRITLKSDCMQRKLADQVISRLENGGRKPIACTIINLDDNLLKNHDSHLIHLPFFPEIVDFMGFSPVIVMILKEQNTVKKIRNILGLINSQKAPVGTIRGDFGLDKMRNTAHASDSKDIAEKEIAKFFK